MAIKYSMDDMKHMSYFEKITRSRVKDCFSDANNMLTFVVLPGEILKAIGKAAANVKKLETKLARKIRIIEFNKNPERLVKNLLHPYKAKNIEMNEEGVISVIPIDIKSRGFMIGKNASTLKNNEKILKRYFPDIKELKILPIGNGQRQENKF